jgi:hypothetical protein
MVDRWMQKAFSSHKKGALHKQLGYPQSKTIPRGILRTIKNAPIGAHVRVRGHSLKVTRLLKNRSVLAYNAGKK